MVIEKVIARDPEGFPEDIWIFNSILKSNKLGIVTYIYRELSDTKQKEPREVKAIEDSRYLSSILLNTIAVKGDSKKPDTSCIQDKVGECVIALASLSTYEIQDILKGINLEVLSILIKKGKSNITERHKERRMKFLNININNEVNYLEFIKELRDTNKNYESIKDKIQLSVYGICKELVIDNSKIDSDSVIHIGKELMKLKTLIFSEEWFSVLSNIENVIYDDKKGKINAYLSENKEKILDEEQRWLIAYKPRLTSGNARLLI